MTSIFYSWQSDRPNRTNRNLIEKALRQAAKRISESLKIEPRIEKDTTGISGSPSLAITILERITSASAVVCDLTFVGTNADDEPIPNPNVMLEYGYALRDKGDFAIIGVMNTAWGGPEDLPFDLRHKRWPIVYCLADKDDEKNKSDTGQIVSDLSKKLEHALRATITTDAPTPPKTARPLFSPVAPYVGADANKALVSPLLGYLPTDLFRGPDREQSGSPIWLRKGPAVYLRLLPKFATSKLAYTDLVSAIKGPNGLRDLNHDRAPGDFQVCRNPNGVASFTICTESSPDQSGNCFAWSYTQVYRSGEIWGVDTYSIEPDRVSAMLNMKGKLLPIIYVEQMLIRKLDEYKKFMSDTLKIAPPFIWSAGFKDIEDYILVYDRKFPAGREFSGPCFERSLDGWGEIAELSIKGSEILEPFFQDIWDSFGVRRPVIENGEIR
ncbi:MAG: hypothetical protein WD270_01300 [Acetobacterales bacterium]